MRLLELKIPPLAVTVLFAALMWLVSRLTPDFPASVTVQIAIPAVLLVLSAVIGIGGIRSFRQADTTVNPLSPERSTSLVQGGIFRYTRNPMYLALLTGLIAWGAWLSNWFALALTIVFVVYMNRFQIAPEERALERLFGKEFLVYKKQVRRWL